MTKWEYVKIAPRNYDSGQLDDQVTALGAQEWEMCAVTPEIMAADLAWLPSYIWFKRAIDDGAGS